MENLEPLYIAGEKVKWCIYFTKQFGNPSNSWTFSQHWFIIYLPKGSENIHSCKNFHMNTHSSIAHSIQKMGGNPQMSEQWWIYREQMWYIYTMEYDSAVKRYGVLEVHYNMDKTWKHFTHWKKIETKGQLFVWFHLYDKLIETKIY